MAALTANLKHMNENKTGKDLTKEAPRSANDRIGGFAIIARTIDKCRAMLWEIPANIISIAR